MTAKKYKCRILVSIPFEKEVYDKYRELLPKGITVGDEINEFAKQRNSEMEGENIDNSGLKIFENIPLNANPVFQEQIAKLDVLNMSSSELQQIIHSIGDRKTLANVANLAHIVESVARTRIQKMK